MWHTVLRLDTSIDGHFNESTLAGVRGGGTMNKTDLIDHVATQTDMSKAAAGRAIDALIDGIKDVALVALHRAHWHPARTGHFSTTKTK
jgi:hypothetical protein